MSLSVSGMTGCVLLKNDSERIDRLHATLLRKIMHGESTLYRPDGTVSSRFTNVKVLQFWKIVLHFSEVRVLRIQQYQAWSQFTQAFVQVLGAFFCCFGGGTVFDAQGRVDQNIVTPLNPFCGQFLADMDYLHNFEDGSVFMDVLDARFALLFNESESDVREMFGSLNLHLLRALHFQVHYPPPSELNTGSAIPTPIDSALSSNRDRRIPLSLFLDRFAGRRRYEERMREAWIG